MTGTDVVHSGIMDHLWMDCLAAVAFGTVAILMMGLGYLLIDFKLRRVDLQAEVAKGNLAAAVFSSAIVLGIAVVVATVINGVLR